MPPMIKSQCATFCIKFILKIKITINPYLDHLISNKVYNAIFCNEIVAVYKPIPPEDGLQGETRNPLWLNPGGLSRRPNQFGRYFA